MRNRIIVVTSLFLLSTLNWSQQQPAGSSAPAGAQQGMPGMDMSGHDMSNMPMKDMPMGDNDASTHAMHSMEGHMDMGPHMKMTALRPAKPGDAERAKEVVEEARKASEHYIDYHVALAEGFKIFHPEFRRRCITSPTTGTRWKRLSISIQNTRLRCSMKSMATTTN